MVTIGGAVMVLALAASGYVVGLVAGFTMGQTEARRRCHDAMVIGFKNEEAPPCSRTSSTSVT